MIVHGIEKGIPLPDVPKPTSKSGSRWSELTTTLMHSEVGDSFLVEQVEKTTLSGYISRLIRKYEPTWKFATRKLKPGIYRVWRIK